MNASTQKKANWYHTTIAAILICTSVFFFTPKPADALVLAIIAAQSAATLAVSVVVTAVVADAIILCAVGIICGGGGGGGEPANSCNANKGNSCNSSPNYCGKTNTGTISCSGSCSATPPSDYTGSCSVSSNYCGQPGGGDLRCDGTCVNTTPPPPDTNCNNFTLGDDALNIAPPLVRKGADVVISWDLGLNFPTNCTLEGPNLGGFTFGPNDQTGSVTVTVTGPHRYTLTCGTESISKDVRILPELYET